MVRLDCCRCASVGLCAVKLLLFERLNANKYGFKYGAFCQIKTCCDVEIWNELHPPFSLVKCLDYTCPKKSYAVIIVIYFYK